MSWTELREIINYNGLIYKHVPPVLFLLLVSLLSLLPLLLQLGSRLHVLACSRCLLRTDAAACCRGASWSWCTTAGWLPPSAAGVSSMCLLGNSSGGGHIGKPLLKKLHCWGSWWTGTRSYMYGVTLVLVFAAAHIAELLSRKAALLPVRDSIAWSVEDRVTVSEEYDDDGFNGWGSAS